MTMNADNDRHIGLLLFSSLVVAGVMIGLILFTLERFTMAPAQTPPECSEMLEDQCGPGQECIDGTCQEAQDRRPTCASGAVCTADCACGFPRECVDNRCIMPLPPAPANVCDERAQQTIVRLDARYKSCLTDAGNKDPLSCSADEFEKFLIDNSDFGEVLTTYGEALLLVFPKNKPLYHTEKRDEWPDSATFAHFLDFVREREPQFKIASRIIVMGRATKTMSAQEDYFFARGRVTFAQELLTQLGDKLETGLLTRKLMMFAVGSDNKLDLEYLLNHRIRVIGWRRVEEENIGKALEVLRGGGILPRATRKSVEDTINRSVIIVAVPCPLPEVAP